MSQLPCSFLLMCVESGSGSGSQVQAQCDEDGANLKFPRATVPPQIHNLASVPLARHSTTVLFLLLPPCSFLLTPCLRFSAPQRDTLPPCLWDSRGRCLHSDHVPVAAWLHQGHCLLCLVRGSGVRNTGAFLPGRRLSACRVLWRFSVWCPIALVASAHSQNGLSATSASLKQKQCQSFNLRGEALWWASRAVHLHVEEGSTGGDRTQV